MKKIIQTAYTKSLFFTQQVQKTPYQTSTKPNQKIIRKIYRVFLSIFTGKTQ
jgi:hypothetical protein